MGEIDAIRGRYAHYGNTLAAGTAVADVQLLLAEIERLTAANADLTDRLDRTLHELREVAAERDEERAKVEVLLVGDKKLSSRIWLGEECARLKAERDAANAALKEHIDLLDEARTERDAARAELARIADQPYPTSGEWRALVAAARKNAAASTEMQP